MPTPRLAETGKNPSSSRHHDMYGSPPRLNHIVPPVATEHNSQVQMPVPIIHGKTPLERITTSPQSLRGSPSHSADIPVESALDPPSVPANPSSSRSSANPSTQIPAQSAQEILAKGVQPLNPISRKKPEINVNPSLPVPSPASFNSYFSPGTPSMRMVESDSPATPSGWGGWFKKKLQNFAGAPPG